MHGARLYHTLRQEKRGDSFRFPLAVFGSIIHLTLDEGVCGCIVLKLRFHGLGLSR